MGLRSSHSVAYTLIKINMGTGWWQAQFVEWGGSVIDWQWLNDLTNETSPPTTESPVGFHPTPSSRHNTRWRGQWLHKHMKTMVWLQIDTYDFPYSRLHTAYITVTYLNSSWNTFRRAWRQRFASWKLLLPNNNGICAIKGNIGEYPGAVESISMVTRKSK